MVSLDQTPLGKSTAYPDRYDPSLLFSIERGPQRMPLGLTAPLPFSGVDIWTAYEITWLDERGKPQLAIGEFRVPADSPATVESKSFKLYLGSFMQERIGTDTALGRIITADLLRACGAHVEVRLTRELGRLAIAELPGQSLDEMDLAIDHFEPQPDALAADGETVEESLRSSLFKSNCPVTGQPDFGDILVRYRGRRIDHRGLLTYLVSFRKHRAFHETCVERIFMDITHRCRPEALTIYGRFTRRGGIDINPFRSNFESPPEDVRTPRQ